MEVINTRSSTRQRASSPARASRALPPRAPTTPNQPTAAPAKPKATTRPLETDVAAWFHAAGLPHPIVRFTCQRTQVLQGKVFVFDVYDSFGSSLARYEEAAGLVVRKDLSREQRMRAINGLIEKRRVEIGGHTGIQIELTRDENDVRLVYYQPDDVFYWNSWKRNAALLGVPQYALPALEGAIVFGVLLIVLGYLLWGSTGATAGVATSYAASLLPKP